MTLATKYQAGTVIGVAALLAAVLGFSSLVSAAVAPTVAVTVRNSSDAVITNAPVGASVHARVEVASTSATTSPEGTVDFRWYDNLSCSGTATAQTGVSLNSNGIASSNSVVLPGGGLSFRAHYNGEEDVYTEADSACVAVSANDDDDNDTSLSLSLSDSNVTEDSSVYAIPSLTGETSGADGTIAYKVYSNNSCSNLYTNAGSKTVTNGSTPNSDSVEFSTPGTYYWQAVYSGDGDNEAATSSCTGATLTVVDEDGTPDDDDDEEGDGSISGTVFNDKNKNGRQNDGESGLSGWTVWLHKKADSNNGNGIWNWLKRGNNGNASYNDPIVATVTTDSNGNYSFGDLEEGNYFVEQKVESGWKQTSADKKVAIRDSDDSVDVDFSNVEKNSNNGNGNGGNNGNGNGNGNSGHGNDDDDDDDNDGRGNGKDRSNDRGGWRNWFDRFDFNVRGEAKVNSNR